MERDQTLVAAATHGTFGGIRDPSLASVYEEEKPDLNKQTFQAEPDFVGSLIVVSDKPMQFEIRDPSEYLHKPNVPETP